jgi:hypothetical protein
MSTLPRQCHVTAGGKTREKNLKNRNDFSNWLRIFGHRRTQTHTDSFFKEKIRLCISVWVRG